MTLSEIEERLAKATPGPWKAVKFNGNAWPEERASIDANGHAVAISPRYVDVEDAWPDFELLAAAPELLRTLVDELKHEREEYHLLMLSRDAMQTERDDARMQVKALLEEQVVLELNGIEGD